uniref:Uncharacterized protein n=1 Tax=Arundo donax TaxID=35708 RepID=A0A0A9F0N2_ARUDO
MVPFEFVKTEQKLGYEPVGIDLNGSIDPMSRQIQLIIRKKTNHIHDETPKKIPKFCSPATSIERKILEHKTNKS